MLAFPERKIQRLPLLAALFILHSTIIDIDIVRVSFKVIISLFLHLFIVL